MSTSRWQGEEFRSEFGEFVSACVGPLHDFACVRLRPWSTVWRATTEQGTFYAKANCRGHRHEADTMVRLNALSPHHVIPVAGTDLERGWLLTPDQGGTLRRGGGPPTDLDTWCRIVAAYGELQRDVSEQAGAFHLTVLDPATAVDRVRGYLAELTTLTDHDVTQIQRVLPDVARWADQVASLGLPLTLQHNDLHDTNVFVDPGGGIRFFDFANAVVADPLSVLLVPLRVVASDLACAPDDPRLWRVANAALEPWSDLVPVSALRAALPAALQLGRLCRVQSWQRSLTTMSSPERAEHGDAPGRWLRSLTEPSTLVMAADPA